MQFWSGARFYRGAWKALRGGTANSDSHTASVEVLGYPRNVVFGGHSLAEFDVDAFNRALADGRGAHAARDTLEEVRRYWTRTLGAVHVVTPDPALNMLANGWLVYQTLACRIWGRSALYQSSGAYGYRDQEYFRLKLHALHTTRYALIG